MYNRVKHFDSLCILQVQAGLSKATRFVGPNNFLVQHFFGYTHIFDLKEYWVKKISIISQSYQTTLHFTGLY